MVGSPARTDEESSKQQQQTNRIAIEDGADSNPPPASAARDLLRPVGRAIVSIRVISTTTTCEHNSHIMVVVNVFCSFSFCVGDGGDMAEAHVHDLWYGTFILYLDWCFQCAVRRCHWRYCCHGLNADMVFDSSIAKAKKLKEDMLLVLGTWGFSTDATPTDKNIL